MGMAGGVGRGERNELLLVFFHGRGRGSEEDVNQTPVSQSKAASHIRPPPLAAKDALANLEGPASRFSHGRGGAHHLAVLNEGTMDRFYSKSPHSACNENQIRWTKKLSS